MAKTPAREAPKAKPPDNRTQFERMTDLTRRIVQVPKSELRSGKPTEKPKPKPEPSKPSQPSQPRPPSTVRILIKGPSGPKKQKGNR
jgi:hypothetical protein